MPHNVSIVIPTYQGASWLQETLPVIQAQSYAGEFEIIAIDSSSTDGTRDLLAAYGAHISVIPQSAFGHGFVRNKGVQIAQHPLIIFLSQDALPIGKQWLSSMVSLLDDKTIGAAHICQHPRPNATPLEVFFHKEMYPAHNKRFTLNDETTLTLDKIFFSNVCSITHRQLALKFPFREDLIMSEDQAYAKVLLQAGYDTYYSADVGVIHSHQYDIWTLFQRHFDSAYSLTGITDDTLSSNAQAGIRYIQREIQFLIKNKHWLWLLYLPFYETARISAHLLGGHAHTIPMFFRKRMSLHHYFWHRHQSANQQQNVHNHKDTAY